MADASYGGERWLTITEYPDYAVSDFGNVKRIALEPAYRCGRLLKPKVRSDGYPEVTLYRLGKPYFRRVHQLVCAAFHGPSMDGQEVAHGDGNRANAKATNVRWATKSKNYNDRNLHGTHNKGERNAAAKLTRERVDEVRRLSATMPSRAVARMLGMSKSQVGNIVGGRCWVDVG